MKTRDEILAIHDREAPLADLGPYIAGFRAGERSRFWAFLWCGKSKGQIALEKWEANYEQSIIEHFDQRRASRLAFREYCRAHPYPTGPVPDNNWL